MDSCKCSLVNTLQVAVYDMGHKLLLINPALTQAGRKQLSVAGLATMEPLGLAYVAALTPPDWDIRIVDEVVEGLPEDFQPDLVGLTSLTPTAPRAYELAQRFSIRGVPVVMGGMHATLCPDEAERYVDVVVRGEAESVWGQVIQDYEANALRRRYEGGASELSRLPFPRRDLYRRRYRIALVSASRGCRNRCEFCAIWKFEGGRFRARPVEDVLAELPHVPPAWGTLFTDDNLMSDRSYALELFRAMAARGLRRRHAVQVSLDIADDDELLDALKASGCFAVLIGLESVSETTLKTMRKGINLRVGVERYADKVARLHARGLMVAATFIFGGDGDTADIFDQTARFVLDAGVDLAHFGLLIPTPGTDVFERLAREGRLLLTPDPAEYALFDLNHATFVPRAMSPRELEAGLSDATQAVTGWPVALRRAARTWRDTGHLSSAIISLLWTRTGLHRRVFGVH
jgi:radical SAM superfamily enzyme YgiQ (UPF0313 family)